MKKKIKIPETYMGYPTKDLLQTWEEIKSSKGTKSPEDQILAMNRFLREYKFGLFGVDVD